MSRVAIIGAGGIGAFLAARLIAAGHEVSVLARGAHLDAIRAEGITLIEPAGTTCHRPARVSDDAGDLGENDLAIFGVKGHRWPTRCARPKPVSPRMVLRCRSRTASTGPKCCARRWAMRARSSVWRGSSPTSPGRRDHPLRRHRELHDRCARRQPDRQAGEVVDLLRKAGVEAPDHPDVRVDLWTKFCLFNPMSNATAATRKRIGAIRDDDAAWALFGAMVREVEAVARARGVPLADDVVEQTIGIASRLPPEGRASMAHDLEQGKPLELDHIGGALVAMGAEAGVPTPVTEVLYGVLSPWKDGAPRLTTRPPARPTDGRRARKRPRRDRPAGPSCFQSRGLSLIAGSSPRCPRRRSSCREALRRRRSHLPRARPIRPGG